jgi:phosphoribosylformimino-5-aminoimidazole carboxamide ribotide isomerase
VELDRGRIIASGGVSSLDDVLAVQAAGCGGAIVGRAIYEGQVDLADLVRALGANPPRP